LPRPAGSPPFPYTTLFRSRTAGRLRATQDAILNFTVQSTDNVHDEQWRGRQRLISGRRLRGNRDFSTMASRIKGHRILAVLVLLAAALWVGTGEFSSVGSEEAHASQARPDAPAPGAEPAKSGLRTVAAVTPVFEEHARELRISGVTGADKRAELAARASRVIATLAIAKGDTVEADQIVMTVEGAEVAAAVAEARATLAQRA